MIRNRITPTYTDEQIESILTANMRRRCPSLDELDESFVMPADAWYGIIDAVREISKLTADEIYESQEESGEESDFVEKYNLTYNGTIQNKNKWNTHKSN